MNWRGLIGGFRSVVEHDVHAHGPPASGQPASPATSEPPNLVGTEERKTMSLNRSSHPNSYSPLAVLTLLATLIIFQAGCSKDASGVMKAYLDQENCLDRTKFILDPDANRPLLAEHYKDTKDCRRKYESIKPDGCDKLADGDYCSVEVVFEKNDTSYYGIKKTPDGLKIDWRSSMGYNPVSLPAFMAQRTTTPRLFRLWAELQNYYNFEYSNAERTHVSVNLRDKEGKSIAGYIRRDAPTAPALLDILKDGKRHAVILELQYMPDSRDASVVEIRRFVSNYWRQLPEEIVPTSTAPQLRGASASPATSQQEARSRPTSTCDLLSKVNLRGDASECAKLVSCCCAGDPPNLLGKSATADVACMGAPGELTKENGTADCKRYRQIVISLYRADGKPVPQACSDAPSVGPVSPQASPARGSSPSTPQGGTTTAKAPQEPPAALPPAALPPAPGPASPGTGSKGGCGCRPGDLVCAMKCAKK